MELTCCIPLKIVSICWKHRLYEALFYIYNKGMNDYTTPLQQLIKKLSNLQQENNGNKDQLGYKLLLYINCCLTGKAFPYGKLPSGCSCCFNIKKPCSINCK